MKKEVENKKKRFKLFDMNRDGKGVYDQEDRKPTFTFFFKLYFRKFSQLLRLNVIMLLMVIPVIAVLFMFLLGDKTASSTEYLYAPLYGMSVSAPALTPVTSLVDLVLIQMDLPISSPFMNILTICLAIVLAITWGWLNTGAAYVLRGLFRGDPVFVFSDFIYGVKKNFKQAFVLGLIDFICIAVLAVDFTYFYNNGGTFGLDFMYFAIFALLLIYLTMRFYMYLLLITFELKTFKILKNSLIFSVLGLKRNVLAFLGIALLLALHILLLVAFLPIGISIPLVLPFVYILASFGFIATYAAYPVIEKYMITPYKTEDPVEDLEDLYE